MNPKSINSKAERLNLALLKLASIPEYKVVLAELEEIRKELIENSYSAKSGEEALKVLGVIKGIGIALNIKDRYSK